MLGAEPVHALARQLRASRRRRRRRGAPPGACARRCASTSTSSGRSACPPGNLQAAARDVRYDAAERLRDRTGADGDRHRPHPHRRRRDVLYRLAASPGSPRAARAARRATAASSGRCSASGASGSASWRSPPGCRSPTTRPTRDPTFARNRIRAEVLPVLRESTRRAEPQHRRDPRRARRGGRSCSSGSCSRRSPRPAPAPARSAIPAAALAGWEPGAAAARPARARRARRRPPRSRWARERAAEIVRLAARARGRRWSSSAAACGAICESGFVRFRAGGRRRRPGAGRAAAARAARGSAAGRSAPSFIPGPVEPGGPRARDARRRARSAAELEVRTWREGDRIRPLGMEGRRRSRTCSRTAACRARCAHTLPVVTVDGDGRLGGRRRGLRATSGSTPTASGSRCSARAVAGQRPTSERHVATATDSSVSACGRRGTTRDRDRRDPRRGRGPAAARRRARRARSAATTRAATW